MYFPARMESDAIPSELHLKQHVDELAQHQVDDQERQQDEEAPQGLGDE